MSTSENKLLLIVSLIIFSCVLTYFPVFAEANEDNFPIPVLLDDKGQAVFQLSFQSKGLFWSDGNGLYFIDGEDRDEDDDLYYWHFNENNAKIQTKDIFGKIKTSGYEGETLSQDFLFFPLTDRLISFSFLDGTILQLQEQKWEPLGLLDVNDPALYDLWFGGTKQIVMDDDTLCFLVPQRGQESMNALIFFSLISHTYSLQKDTQIQAIAAYKTNELLVYDHGVIKPYLWTVRMFGNTITTADVPPAPFAYDATLDCLYFIENRDIYAKHPGQNKIRIRNISLTPSLDELENWLGEYHKDTVPTLLPLPNNMLCYRNVSWPYGEGDDYVKNTDFVFVSQCNPITKEPSTLHVADRVTPLADAFFQLTHPNVVIHPCVIDRAELYKPASQLTTDHAVDIFAVYTTEESGKLIDEGSVRELSASTSISKLASLYMPQIQKILIMNGMPMGLATDVSFQVWQYNQLKWEELGLPAPPQTYTEMFELFSTWEKHHQRAFPQESLFGAGAYSNPKSGLWLTATYQYMISCVKESKPLRFNTPEYHALLNQIMDVPEIKTNEWRSLIRGMRAFTPRRESLQTLDLNWDEEDYSRIMPPQITLDQSQGIFSSLRILVLSNTAPSPELGLEYLSFMADYLIAYDPAAVYCLSGGRELPPSFEEFTPHLAEKFKEGGLPNRINSATNAYSIESEEISRESLDFYRQISPFFVFSYDYVKILLDIIEVDPQLPFPWHENQSTAIGTTSLDYFIAQLDERVMTLLSDK